MKNIATFIFISLLTFLISSCTVTQYANKVTNWVQTHCPRTEVKNPLTGEINIHFECDSLWQTQAIQDKCKAANLYIDVSNGRISGNVRCNTPAVDFPQLLKIQK